MIFRFIKIVIILISLIPLSSYSLSLFMNELTVMIFVAENGMKQYYKSHGAYPKNFVAMNSPLTCSPCWEAKMHYPSSSDKLSWKP